ncbi:uncharacterized protein E5676_scaffold142G001700 [Cucumis melo var. makuwa]|uniref:Uncharacterized protein n=1 Tax=Cucumis melo var. makuwa TaxID=1194695 RepID=A0A5D3DHU8_CUCMM|nr:uncharacterized protein E5676_scaffold142G001700 [Cucumis melo var. makuwa]
MHIKVLNGWSNKSFDILFELLRAMFPMYSTTIPSSFYEAKRKLSDLGLGYETIHSCKYDYVLYWKEWGDLQHYPTCGSVDMKWHKDKRVETDDVLRHLADVEGLKHFDYEFSDFASDPWNVRLGKNQSYHECSVGPTRFEDKKVFTPDRSRWTDVGREYIEIVKGDLQNKQLFSCRSNNGRTRLLDKSSLTIIAATSSRFYNDSMSSLSNKAAEDAHNQMLGFQFQPTLESS